MPDVLASLVFFAAALLAILTCVSLRAGRVAVLPAHIVFDRGAQPLAFWSIIALQALTAASLGWLALH